LFFFINIITVAILAQEQLSQIKKCRVVAKMTTLPNAAVPICCTCLSEKKVRVVLFGTGKPAYQFPYLKVDDKYIAYLCEECVDLFALIRVLKENRKAKYEDNDKLYPFSVEHKNTIVSRFIRRPSPTILCASEAGQNQS